MTVDLQQNLKRMFREWGRTDIEATEFYKSVEKDAGNPILILMGGTTKTQKENWSKIKQVAEEALEDLKESV